jgi:hypothetical protein
MCKRKINVIIENMGNILELDFIGFFKILQDENITNKEENSFLEKYFFDKLASKFLSSI